jgi:hypothetical protein
LSIRKAIVAAAGVALTVGLSVGLAGTAYAADPTVPAATWNEIYIPFDNIAGNRLCVDVTNGSTSAGTALQFYSCHGYGSDGGPQRWHFVLFPHNSGLVMIQNTQSNLCISTPPGAALVSGTRLAQEPCGTLATIWLIRAENDNGTNPLIQLAKLDNQDGTPSFSNNLCMAAGNMGDDNHTPLVATTCQPFTDLSQVLELA